MIRRSVLIMMRWIKEILIMIWTMITSRVVLCWMFVCCSMSEYTFANCLLFFIGWKGFRHSSLFSEERRRLGIAGSSRLDDAARTDCRTDELRLSYGFLIQEEQRHQNWSEERGKEWRNAAAAHLFSFQHQHSHVPVVCSSQESIAGSRSFSLE